jgi:N6-adenosine-specific RNA methylase IME4
MMLDGLPRNHFRAILADPPWRFRTWSETNQSRAPSNHYGLMPTAEIAALPVADLCSPDCVLMMWACWPTLLDAIRVMESWGFTYKTCAFSWLKADPYRLWTLEEDVRMGLGYWTRANTEPCLLATRGKPKRRHADVRQGIVEKAREHSRKPDCVHDRIERLVAGPYLELFARATRPGWTCVGNEVGKFDARDSIQHRPDLQSPVLDKVTDL